MNPSLYLFLRKLTNDQLINVLCNSVERLIEIEEISYREGDYECKEDLYWDSCGISLTVRK